MDVRAGLRHSVVFLVVVGTAAIAACTGEDAQPVAPAPDGGEIPDATPPTGDTGPGPAKPKAIGETCAAAGDCASGFCADGVCCDTACTEQCETCGGTTKGTCTRVIGAPVAPRPACTGAGTSCEGRCSGAAACTYVPAATICGASCGGTCDGAGTCSDTGGGACADGFACESAGKCFTSCTATAQCQPNFDCDLTDNKCKRIPESNCFDGVDNNGDGKADCQDPTCTAAIAMCVPAVGAGAAIGTVVDTLPCPVGFGGGNQNLNQGLQPGSCSGCSCKTRCSGSASVYSTNNCSGGGIAGLNFEGTQGDDSPCENDPDVNAQSIKISFLSKTGCTGSGTNTWTAASPAWTTSKVWCTQNQSSNTCGQNMLCVPKVASGISAKVAAGGTCPTGYSGTNGTYYPTFSNGVCQSCSVCTAGTNFNCGLFGFAFYTSGACSGSNQFTAGNLSNYTTSCADFGTTRNVQSMRINFVGNSDDCVKNSTISTPAAGTNGQLVCNLP